VYRVINWVMAVLFLFAAVVQYNDPDPVRWMAMYLAACDAWEMKSETFEEAREASGLVIVTAWMLVLFVWRRPSLRD
jgi:Transmembrane family 220, helix